MKVTVMGTGAQGSIIARRLAEEKTVKEVVCADYNAETARRVAGPLKKARDVQVDARNLAEITACSRGAALIVNALPPDFNLNVMRAALECGANYQDLASGPVEDTDFVSAVKRQLAMDAEFRAANLTALFDTGSAPGLVSVLSRHSADKLEKIERITIYVYDGIWTNRFIPFWWSPETAFGDMAARPINYVNGRFETVEPYNDPVMVDLRGLGPRRLVDHEHEEPVTFGLLADKVFKGCPNVGFKYGGPALELAWSFYKMGLLSHKPVSLKGAEVVPLDLVCALTPPAPADPKEIAAVLEEGMALEEGAVLVRVEGGREGRQTVIDSYVNAPGLTESFASHGISHETFITGQSAFLFSRLLLRGQIDRTGVFPPEMLELEVREQYLSGAAELGITIDEIVTTRLF
jgi:saccharopine dehydrogenase (NAD+, L-lysine-forming)